jgi:hypothetical protein
MFPVCCASLTLVHNYDINKSNDLGLISVYLFSMTYSFETVNESMIKQLSPWASFCQVPESSYKQPLIVFLYYIHDKLNALKPCGQAYIDICKLVRSCL